MNKRWWKKPLIPGFRATTYFKAFLINALATALIATIAVITQDNLDKNTEITGVPRGLITFFTALVGAFLTYSILHILFHFGGGMLI